MKWMVLYNKKIKPKLEGGMNTGGEFPIMIGVLEDSDGLYRAFSEIKLLERVEPLVMVSLRVFTSQDSCESYLQDHVCPFFSIKMDEITPDFTGSWDKGFSKGNAILVANMISGTFGFAIDPDDKDFGISDKTLFQEALYLPDSSILILDSAFNQFIDKYAPMIQVLNSEMETIHVNSGKASDSHEELVEYLNSVHTKFKDLLEKHSRYTGEFVNGFKKIIEDEGFHPVAVKVRKDKKVENGSKNLH